MLGLVVSEKSRFGPIRTDFHGIEESQIIAIRVVDLMVVIIRLSNTKLSITQTSSTIWAMITAVKYSRKARHS